MKEGEERRCHDASFLPPVLCKPYSPLGRVWKVLWLVASSKLVSATSLLDTHTSGSPSSWNCMFGRPLREAVFNSLLAWRGRAG